MIPIGSILKINLQGNHNYFSMILTHLQQRSKNHDKEHNIKDSINELSVP